MSQAWNGPSELTSYIAGPSCQKDLAKKERLRLGRDRIGVAVCVCGVFSFFLHPQFKFIVCNRIEIVTW